MKRVCFTTNRFITWDTEQLLMQEQIGVLFLIQCMQEQH